MRQLIKHDFKESWLEMVIANACILGGLILLGAFFRIMFSIDISSESALPVIYSYVCILFPFIIFAGIVLAFISIVKNLYQKLVGNQAYIVYSLPVSTDALLLTKILVTTIWIFSIILSFLLGLLFLILILGDFRSQIEVLSNLADLLFSNFGAFIGYLVTIFVNIILLITQILLTLAILNTGTIRKAKVIIGLLIFEAIGYAMQIVKILPNTFSFGFGTNGEWTTFNSFGVSTILLSFLSVVNGTLYCFNIPVFLVNVGFIILFYFLTRYIINKKMELE